MNANKIVGGGTAGGVLGAMIVYAAGRFGASLTAEDGAMASVALVGVCAFVAHNGLVGAASVLWRGSKPGSTDPPAGV